MTQQLPASLQSIAPVISQYGYLAVVGLLFLEDFGVPVPGETVLIAAAVFAGLHKLNIILLVVLAIASAFAGDNVGYAIGKYGGRALVHKFGKYVFITSEKLDKTQAFFERNGVKVVLVARFVEGLRQLNGILAGISSMPWKKFALFNALGATLWVSVWCAVGYFGGDHIDTIEKYGTYLASVAAAGVVGYFVIMLLRRRREAK